MFFNRFGGDAHCLRSRRLFSLSLTYANIARYPIIMDRSAGVCPREDSARRLSEEGVAFKIESLTMTLKGPVTKNPKHPKLNAATGSYTLPRTIICVVKSAPARTQNSEMRFETGTPVMAHVAVYLTEYAII